MSLTIQVISFQNQTPPSNDMSVTIDRTNCSIGRSDGNDFVLPDPERIVSHHHAIIRYKNNAYFLSDKSTNGTSINHTSEPIGDKQVLLKDGDIIAMGKYQCRISLQQEEVDTAPESVAVDSPVMDFGIGDWKPPSHKNSSTIEEQKAFSLDTAPDISKVPASASLNSIFDSEQTPTDDIIPKGYDFLNPKNPVSADSQVDNIPRGSVENLYFRPPEPIQQEPQHSTEKSLEQIFQPSPTTANSLEEFETEGSEEVAVAHKQTTDSPATKNVAGGISEAKENKATEEQHLLNAFLKGAELTQLQIPNTEISNFMRNSGELLRELVYGIKQTLDTRTNIKDEFRLNMTILRPVQNNPIKFSIDVDDALTKLLQPPKGYLPPVKAVQEVTDDLQAHQMATLEGLRAALHSLIDQFDPKVLEKNFQNTSITDNLLPALKKAKHWELFKTQYNRVAQDAENDFLMLLRDSFSSAYGQQIEKLKRSRE